MKYIMTTVIGNTRRGQELYLEHLSYLIYTKSIYNRHCQMLLTSHRILKSNILCLRSYILLLVPFLFIKYLKQNNNLVAHYRFYINKF